MLRDGRWTGPLPWPEGSQTLAAALKRLAKMFVGPPKAALGSYHATHGTVRPAPAKSIDGASASWVGVDVERRRGPLRHPGAVLERADEDLLRAGGNLLLERRPRDLDLAGRDRAARDVGDAGVLARVDRVGEIVVHLRALGRKRQEGRTCRGGRKQHARRPPERRSFAEDCVRA